MFLPFEKRNESNTAIVELRPFDAEKRATRLTNDAFWESENESQFGTPNFGYMLPKCSLFTNTQAYSLHIVGQQSRV